MSCGHADLVEVEVDDRPVEDPEDHALAEQGRQGRDPDVDLVAADGQLDPAVLRQPALGDVEVRHDLDPRRDRRGQVARRRHQLVEHAVHPIPHLVLVLERLEVDVRRLVLDRQQQHHVQELADRRGLGHLLDRLEVDRVLVAVRELREPLVVLDLLDDVLDRLLLAGVEPGDRRHHVRLGRDHRLDVDPEERLDAVQGRRVARVAHRDGDALVLLVLRDRHDLERRGHRLVDQVGQLRRDRHVAEPDHLHPELLAERLEDLVLGDQAHPGRHLAEQLAVGSLLLLEDLPEGVLVEVAHVHQDRADSTSHETTLPSGRRRSPGRLVDDQRGEPIRAESRTPAEDGREVGAGRRPTRGDDGSDGTERAIRTTRGRAGGRL